MLGLILLWSLFLVENQFFHIFPVNLSHLAETPWFGLVNLELCAKRKVSAKSDNSSGEKVCVELQMHRQEAPGDNCAPL